LAPDDAQTYVHRGIIRERLGHNEEARHDFQHALIVDPNNKRAHRIMLELNAADESPSIYLEIVSRRNEADNYFEKRTATASSSVGDDYSVEISDDLDMEA
jgi:hypothetical protein